MHSMNTAPRHPPPANSASFQARSGRNGKQDRAMGSGGTTQGRQEGPVQSRSVGTNPRCGSWLRHRANCLACLRRQPLPPHFQRDDHPLCQPVAIDAAAKLLRHAATNELAAEARWRGASQDRRTAPLGPDEHHILVRGAAPDIERAAFRRQRPVLQRICCELMHDKGERRGHSLLDV